MHETIVYSKPNCPHCVSAKRMLDNLKIEYSERVLGADLSREDLLSLFPNARTMPQIVLHGEHIGGYAELQLALT